MLHLIYGSSFTKRTQILRYLDTNKMENVSFVSKKKLEALVVNVVCHDKMHMFAKFGHIITLVCLCFMQGENALVCPRRVERIV
jgi:hypothetical protein